MVRMMQHSHPQQSMRSHSSSACLSIAVALSRSRSLPSTLLSSVSPRVSSLALSKLYTKDWLSLFRSCPPCVFCNGQTWRRQRDCWFCNGVLEEWWSTATLGSMADWIDGRRAPVERVPGRLVKSSHCVFVVVHFETQCLRLHRQQYCLRLY
jgi:hypothetical protein